MAVPLDPTSATYMRSSSLNEPQVSFLYRECVGCLQFAQIGTRFDISYVVSNMSRFNNSPTAAHVSSIKRTLKYLRGTLNHTITYGRGPNPNHLTAHYDADYAGDCDDRKSRLGFFFMLNSGPMSWDNKKQTYTTISTTESEYIAASVATQEILWMC